ncbi:Calx-beta domain-containing protein, partial [Thiotrichales bacterium HSG1]|nr:Calx-beta domain-containing protein [Thiotrichales bacterium HSG1]
MKIQFTILVILLGWLIKPAFAAYDLSWNTVDGGGERSTGGTYTLEGTVGQHDANTSSITGGNYRLQGGFWQAVEHNLIINEIDYDNKGADVAEFVELKNISTATINFATTPFTLEFLQDNATVRKTITINSGTLASNDYFVICNDDTKVPNCDQDEADTGFLQNSTEAVALKLNGIIVDRVSYEGAVTGYVEGTSVALEDSHTVALISLSRFPDGTDTNNNNSDFALKCITPGAANSITDSSGCYVLSINDPTAVTEGDSGTTTLNFTVSLSHAAAQAITVNYATADDTATAGSDYTAITATPLTFAAGIGTSTSQTVIITVNGDNANETNETSKVNLSSPSTNAQLSAIATDIEGIGTINNDDSEPTVTLGISGTPLAENAGTATVTATLSAPSYQDVTVDLEFTGTATVGTDYTKSDSIVIAAGTTSNTMTITGTNDALDEDNETAIVDISAVGNGTEHATPQRVTATITDDDDPPTVTLSGGGAFAENTGTSTITATLSTVSGKDVTVALGFTGAATKGTDYTASANSITISAGDADNQESITLTGIDDSNVEGSENIAVDITGVTNGTEVGTQQTTASITDDDVRLTFTDPSNGTVTSGGSLSCSGTCTEDFNLNVTPSLTATAAAGYTFSSWGGNCSGTNNPLSLAMDADKTCSAVFTKNAVYVSTAGNDSTGDGNVGTPYLTITKAIQEVTDGGTVNIAAGTYTEAAMITIDKNVTINGDTTTNTIVDGGNSHRSFDIIGSNTVVMNYLTIRNGNADNSDGNGNDGGAIQNWGTLTLNNSTISGNSATTAGGAFANAGTLTLNNSTISGNSTSDGGGVRNTGGGTVTLNNTTVSNNTVTNNGGGINNVSGTLTLKNALIAGNTSTDTNDVTGTIDTNTNNCIGSDCTSNDGQAITSIAWLDNLGSNGGPTHTHALLIGTPALVVDAGDATTCALAAINNKDQRGETRPVGECDVGAYEASKISIAAGTTPTEAGTIGTYTVTLSPALPNGQSVTVNYNTTSSTATNSDDYSLGSADVSVTVNASNFVINNTTGSALTSIIIDASIVDDSIDDDAETVKVTLTSANNGYIIASISDNATLTITDNDTAGFTVTESSGNTSVNESGTTDTFTVVLDSKPTSNVVITVTSGTITEATVDKASLTFTTTNWNVAQIVTVTGVDDFMTDTNQTTPVTLSVDDANSDDKYDPLADKTVSVTTVDNDIPGITVNPTNGLITTEANGTATFTVMLNTLPTNYVAFSLQSLNATEGTITSHSTDCTNVIPNITAPCVEFSTTNWNSAQTVTITGQNDAIDDGDVNYSIQTNVARSTGTDYNGINPNDVMATNQDDDTASSTVSPTTMSISEPSDSTTFNVKLATEPAADVTIGLTPSSECSATAAGPLTSTNYNAAGVTVTVTATNDNIDDGDQTCTVVTSFTSTDTVYAGINPDDVTVTVGDDDTAGVTVGAVSNIVEGGATGTYTIALDTAPTAGSVTIGITPDAECTVSSSPINISNTTPSTITVTAFNDNDVEGNHTCTISHAITAGPSEYPTNMSVASVTANVTDNDPGVIITQTSGSTAVSEGGATDSYTVKLSTAPTNNVTVTVTPDAQTDVGSGVGTAHTLTFDNTDWKDAQTVTVTADDDAAVENTHSSILSHSSASADAAYDGAGVTFVVDGTITSNVTVNITDNDAPVVPPTTDEPIAIVTPLPSTMTMFVKFAGYGSGTVISSPSGINCQTKDVECKAKFDTASKVKLTAKADTGSIFDRWSGKNCDKEIFLTNGRTCTAYFKLTPRTLTVSYPENGVITSFPVGINCGNNSQICSYEFDGGTDVKLSLQPNNEYILDSWSENCTNGKTQLLKNTTCSATFKVKPIEPVVEPTVPDVIPPVTDNNPTVPTTPNVDKPATPINTVSFSEHNYEVFENAENVNIVINRSGTSGEVKIDLSTTDDSGKANIHYRPIEKTLFWATGDDTKIIFPIEIIDNSEIDGNKEVILSLGNADNANLGLDTSVLTIIDDDVENISTPETPVTSNPVTNNPTSQNNACLSGNIIDITCNFNWNNATDIIIEKKGNISNLVVQSDIKNHGRISNAKITIDNQVTGGIISGYIINYGTLADFEFVGASISGMNKADEVVGTLAGNITNNSKIKGSFENIRLAPNTRIIGGILEQQIIGDKDQPAILESLLIKSGSIISNVILASDVEWEEGVIFEKNVNFLVHTEYMQTNGIAQLPMLGSAVIFNPKNNQTTTSFAIFTGGASENDDVFKRKKTIKRNSKVTIK